jgi:ribosomal protein S27E
VHITICDGCGDVPHYWDYVVSGDGIVYCADCADVHGIENHRRVDCYECGAVIVMSEGEHVLTHNKKLAHYDCVYGNELDGEE